MILSVTNLLRVQKGTVTFFQHYYLLLTDLSQIKIFMVIASTSKPKLTIPGPRVSPFFGRITQVLKFLDDSIGLSRQLFETYGSVVALAEGGGTNVYSPYPNCPGTV